MGQYLIGGVIGAAFGVAVTAVSAVLTRRNMKNGDANSMMAGSMLRTLFDILALLAAYLLRNVLPFPFYGVIIGTALGLSVGNIIQASRIGKKLKDEAKQENTKTDGEVK